MENWTSKRQRFKTAAKGLLKKNPSSFLHISVIVFLCGMFFTYLNNVYMPELYYYEGITAELLLEQMKEFVPTGILAVLMVNVLYLIISSPIELAASEFFFKTAGAANVVLKELLKWVKAEYAAKAIALKIWLLVLSWFWTALLSALPAVILALAAIYTGNIFIFTILLPLPVFGGVLASIRICMYGAADFLLAENTGTGIFNAVRRSLNLLRGHGREFFVFNLSFILWDLLSILTFGVAGLYVYPYKRMSTALFIRELMQNKMEIEPRHSETLGGEV